MSLVRNLDLELQAQELALELFNLKWEYPVYVDMNSKDDAYAMYYFKGSDKNPIPQYIVLNGQYQFSAEQKTDLLKHELCHWACQQRGMQSNDGDVDFEGELYRIGATSTQCDFDLFRSRWIQLECMEGMRGKTGSKYIKYKQYSNSLNYQTRYEVYYRGELIGKVGKTRFKDSHQWKIISKESKYYTYGYETRFLAADDLINEHLLKKAQEEENEYVAI